MRLRLRARARLRLRVKLRLRLRLMLRQRFTFLNGDWHRAWVEAGLDERDVVVEPARAVEAGEARLCV